MAFVTGGLHRYAVSETGDTSRNDGSREEAALRGAINNGIISKFFFAAAFFLARGLVADELGSGVGKEVTARGLNSLWLGPWSNRVTL